MTETPERYFQDDGIDLLIQQTGVLTEAVTGLQLASEKQQLTIEQLAQTMQILIERRDGR
jgi:hypothetical protein